ncbi:MULTISPECIES: hypothetical protein [unclassified Legionella]|uniref:hypothetical protein n=1 Tax=unclassified Legionella TaxID=2622702 RepID=UPI001054D179|nr:MULTISPECIES: hypothetical protein [unclassified Legionella]MDI9819006.1 hypothetical protein [Legionella sp. PL877]
MKKEYRDFRFSRQEKKVKQIERNFQALMRNIVELGPDMSIEQATILSGSALSIMHQLASIEVYQARLPDFIRPEDVLTMVDNIPSLALAIAKLPAWIDCLYRGGNDPLPQFERQITNSCFIGSESKRQILTSCKRFKKGMLADQSPYQNLLQKVNRIRQDIREYMVSRQQGNALDRKRVQTLTVLLNSLDKIAERVEEEELKRFQATNVYLNARQVDRLKIETSHMDNFRKYLPLTRQIAYLQSVLMQQGGTVEKDYNALFRHHFSIGGWWRIMNSKDTTAINKVRALCEAMVEAESARKTILEKMNTAVSNDAPPKVRQMVRNYESMLAGKNSLFSREKLFQPKDRPDEDNPVSSPK